MRRDDLRRAERTDVSPRKDFIIFSSAGFYYYFSFFRVQTPAGSISAKVEMLDDKAPRSQLGAPSFYIENLLRTSGADSSAGESVETSGFKVWGAAPIPVVCRVLETGQPLQKTGGEFPSCAFLCWLETAAL